MKRTMSKGVHYSQSRLSCFQTVMWLCKRSLDKSFKVSERIFWKEQIMTLVLERLKDLVLE